MFCLNDFLKHFVKCTSSCFPLCSIIRLFPRDPEPIKNKGCCVVSEWCNLVFCFFSLKLNFVLVSAAVNKSPFVLQNPVVPYVGQVWFAGIITSESLSVHCAFRNVFTVH